MNGASIAMTGMGVLTPIANSPNELSRALRAGRSGVVRSAGGETGSLLLGFRAKDWAYARLPRAAAETVARVAGRATLPTATACCVAAQALGAAHLTPRHRARAAVIVAGNNLSLDYQARTMLAYAGSPHSLRPSHALAYLDTDAVGAVSEIAGIRGEGWTIGAASASGTLALIAAARLLQSGERDHCLVVAPAAELSEAEIRALRVAGALADPGHDEAGAWPPEQLCRPFDAGRRGFVRGQGAAAVVLERAESARGRHAPSAAYLTGYGQHLDARKGTEPDPEGQACAMDEALRRARLSPRDIDYINAHGTGSAVGDPSEAAALLSVFGPGRRPLVNATKALLGHCLSAAGLLEVVSSAVQLRDGFAHANPNLRTSIEPRLGLVGRSAVTIALHAAVSNSFAFGGINTSVVLERDAASEERARR